MALQIFAICKVAAWAIRSSRPTTTSHMTQAFALKFFSAFCASSSGWMAFGGSSPRGQVGRGAKMAAGSGFPAGPMKRADRKRNTVYANKSSDVPAHRAKKSRMGD